MQTTKSRRTFLSNLPAMLHHESDEALMTLVETETDPLVLAMIEAEIDERTAPVDSRSTLRRILDARTVA